MSNRKSFTLNSRNYRAERKLKDTMFQAKLLGEMTFTVSSLSQKILILPGVDLETNHTHGSLKVLSILSMPLDTISVPFTVPMA